MYCNNAVCSISPSVGPTSLHKMQMWSRNALHGIDALDGRGAGSHGDMAAAADAVYLTS